MQSIAVTNIKGGVGKTTACVNLAFLAAASGLRTLVWDLDPQGAATYLLHDAAPAHVSVKAHQREARAPGHRIAYGI
jgi:chromosome partitioning protein